MIRRNNKRALYESIMRDVAKTVKKHLNEGVKSKITQQDIVDLVVDFICNNPYNITFTVKDLIKYIKSLPNFELFSMRQYKARNYNKQDIIDMAADERVELNDDLKNAVANKLRIINNNLYNKFMDADTFNEIYGFVADILNQTITSVTFDDYGYEVDGSSEYSDYDGNYEDGMHDFLINIIYGYLK